jgi:hypothetical protein
VRIALKVVVLSWLLLAGGCSSDPRLSVSGTVKYKGAPLDQGRIEFHPPGDKGTLSGASIQAGAYHVPQANGLLPATYVVRIYSFDEKGAKVPDTSMPGEPGLGFKERVSPKFNRDSTLQAEVGPGKTTFDFSVE